MSRMSVAYQYWEIGGGPTVGYKLAHGQGHGHGHQYVTDGSSFRRHHNPHESCCLTTFSMYMQSQNDSKAHLCPQKDAAARFATSHSQGSHGSPHSISLHAEIASVSSPHTPKQSVLPDTQETERSLTSVCESRPSILTEGLASLVRPSEPRNGLESGRIAGASGSLKGNTPGLRPHMSQYYNYALPDKGLKVKLGNKPLLDCVSPGEGVISFAPAFEETTRPFDECLTQDSSSSSSSICDGREDSSCTSEDTSGDMEAQSVYRGPLDQMSSLESSLPIKRAGLSKYFGGKSRSFSSLADVSSVSDLAKPDNPYAKRRKMGFNCPLDRHRSYPPLSRSSVAGISKKLPNSGGKNNLAVAVKLGGLTEGQKDYAAVLPGSCRGHQHRTLPARSFSLTDLPVAGNSPPMGRTFARP